MDRPDAAERVAAELRSAPAARPPQYGDPPPYLDLSTVALLGQPKRAPSQGWRKWLYLASFKLINVGESPKVNRINSMVAQVQRPLRGCYRIALLSLKGGVGKTTDHRDTGRDVRLDPR